MNLGLPQDEIYTTMFTEYPDLLDSDQLCKMLKICKGPAYRLLREGRIKYRKVGTEYKIPKVFVLDYLGLVNGNMDAEQAQEGG